MEVISSNDGFKTLVDTEYVEGMDKIRVTFYTQWLDAKNPEELHKQFEMYLDQDGILDFICHLDKTIYNSYY